MEGGDINELHRLYFADQHNVLVNSNGGFYQRGKSYGMETKLFVAAKYLDHKEMRGELRPILSRIAAECRVGWDFVAKIERELVENDRVLTPKEVYLARDNPIGPGSMSMSGEDFYVLYILYRQEPTRSLKSYVYWLFCCTGTIVSESTVSRWFHFAFPISGRLCKPNLVPYDKFRPGNIEKAWEYLGHLSKISPERLKYGDEKSLKGRAIFNKNARRDVLTGLVPRTMTDPDLRNTYSIIGICGISRRSSPVRYRITDTTVDADLFSLEIESAIAHRYLQAGDVLVLDNAANHTGKDNTVLEEWLWTEHMVLVLFLPARAPEWNPIELMWNCMVQRLKYFDIFQLTGSHKVVKAAASILDQITHDEIYRFYEKSGVFDLHR
jgi:transposase